MITRDKINALKFNIQGGLKTDIHPTTFNSRKLPFMQNEFTNNNNNNAGYELTELTKFHNNKNPPEVYHNIKTFSCGLI